jgi:hypothetical protein
MTQGASSATSSTQRQCRADSHRSAWVITVRALCSRTSLSEQTPTIRWTEGKESFACRNCNAWLGGKEVRPKCNYSQQVVDLPKVKEIVHACGEWGLEGAF